jgi:hypothetical protein
MNLNLPSWPANMSRFLIVKTINGNRSAKLAVCQTTSPIPMSA